jgi:hypothetical protein
MGDDDVFGHFPEIVIAATVAAMGATREERLARNEAFFRAINERIRDAATRHPGDGHLYDFICECSDPACVERVSLALPEYERVRGEGTRFVLAPGHDVQSIESVVAALPGHIVVDKLGAAGDVAQALDPR